MSHVVIVGGTKGIGRDIAPFLSQHRVTRIGRSHYESADDRCVNIYDELHQKEPITAFVCCQRYRGVRHEEWEGELETSIELTDELLIWAGQHLENAAVVVMSSVAAVSVEEEQPASYHIAKAALVEMVKYYGLTLGPKQIRVNAIIPGLRIKPEAQAFYDAHPELEELYKRITPLGRMCVAEDLAFEIDHLINPKCYITGQAIVVDGGISLRSHWALARMITPSVKDLPVTQRQAVKA